MVTVLGNYNETFFSQEGLLILKNALGLFNRSYVGFDEERKTREKGDTIKIRIPGRFTVQDAPNTAQSVSTKAHQLVLNYYKEVRFTLTELDLAKAGDVILRDHVEPAVYELANYIDSIYAQTLYKGIAWHVNSAGAALAVADITNAYQTLFDNKVPLGNPADIFGLIGGKEQNDLTQLAAFSQHQGAGPIGVETQVTGDLGRRFNVNWYASQNRPLHTTVALSITGTVALVGAHAEGVTTLAIDAVTTLTGSVAAGDTLVIAGNTQRYVITAAATASGNAITVLIFPALAAAAADNAVVTINQEATRTNQNVLFHRRALAGAFGKLPDLAQFGGLGAQISSVMDPSGISLRAKIYGDHANSAIGVCFDVLFGVVCTDTNLGVRLRHV